MGAPKKLSAMEAFETNMADARHLVGIAESMANTRVYRMCKELRDRIGEALRIPAKDRGDLDCLQSSHLFVTFLPGSGISRSDFDDARPLLRQAIVAGCAAAATRRLRAIEMTVGDWIKIHERYQRKRWGLRGMVLEPYVREHASTSPSKVGQLLSMLGISGWARAVDIERGVASGETEEFLELVTSRRNKIAHEGDRVGRGRSGLSVTETRSALEGLDSVVRAVEVVTGRHRQ